MTAPLLHTTGFFAAPAPVYYESFAPAQPTRRPPVVMLHGGAHTGLCYQRTAAGAPGWAYRFARRGYRVIAPDWPGTGRSGHVPYEALTGGLVVEALGALLHHIGGPLVLLTHSMSGAYGWRLNELHGGLIAAIVGVAPSPPGNIQPAAPVFAETETSVETISFGRRVTLDKFKPGVATREFVEMKLVGGSRFFPREKIAEYHASLCAIPPRLLTERQNLHGSQLRVGDAANFRGKRVLVITGSEDIDHARDIDGAIVDWLNMNGAKAEFHFLSDHGITGNGHMLMMEENADETADVILDWLDAGVADI